jgi:hypothetical protein
MLPISELSLGFNDAEQYKKRENKDLFNKLFIKNKKLDQLLEPSKYFLLGEKGTGKTAYAVWLSNNNYNETISSINFIRETEYEKFLYLKKEKNLGLSDYTNIWKVILLLLISKKISASDTGLIAKYFKYRALNNAIDDYYEDAFSPEIINAIQFVEESAISASLLSQYANADSNRSSKKTFTESKYQINLLYIQRQFEQALSEIKLTQNQTLFIDGIDLRPTWIPYKDYLECVKGLANAVWAINNDFFPSIKDSKGRMKVILLLRPDIFDAISLQNSNNKIIDNSVFLDWRVPYKEFKTSELFKLPNRLLGIGQTNKVITNNNSNYWDNYFPYTLKSQFEDGEHSFISFLRFSYYRPRDIVTMLRVLKDIHIEQGIDRFYFIEDDFRNPQFRRKYSDYLLGEIKDHLSFYYSDKDYEAFLKFFEFLKGKYSFKYSEYLNCYSQFIHFISESGFDTPIFASTADDFLQFLYELNVICCVKKTQQHGNRKFWCFKDRTISNMSPRVTTNCSYEIFYGLGKALNIGDVFE